MDLWGYAEQVNSIYSMQKTAVSFPTCIGIHSHKPLTVINISDMSYNGHNAWSGARKIWGFSLKNGKMFSFHL